MEGNIDATSSDKIPDPPSHFSLDDSLAKELLKLSFNEREAMQEEIHGVRCLSPEETPEMIERSLMEFDTILMEKKSELQFQLQLQLDTEENNDGSTRSVNVLRNAKSLFRVSDFKSAASQLPSEQRESSADDCYLNDPDVRLRFLRCDCFHPQKAVRRMVNFLELTGALFGEYVTERPIRITDFNTRKEEVALQNSRNQYLPFRDRSGRRVFVGVGSCGFNLDCRLRSKIMTFLHWMASEEVETQQKGVVIVAWPSDENSSDSDNSGNKQDLGWEKSIRPRLKKGYRLWQKKITDGMPVRVTSQQAYYKDTPFFRALSTMYYIGMDSHSRSQYKAHYGEPTELRYALASYGIPEQLLPLSNTGTVKTANHSRWINAMRSKMDRDRRRQEKNLTSSIENDKINFSKINDSSNVLEEEDIIDCPGSRDVIFRKGPTYKNNPGNMHFRELIESTHDQHMKASRKEKCRITWNIVREIEKQNGRFLDWSMSREMWIVSKDREKIRTKVAACYKQFNRTMMALQQQNSMKMSSHSSTPEKKNNTSRKPSSKRLQKRQSSTIPAARTAEHGKSYKLDHGTSRDTTYGAFPSKRQKTFSCFCDEYSSSSDSSQSPYQFVQAR